MIAEALALVEKNEERWNEAELYRIKGELRLAQSKASQGQVKTGQDKSEDTDPRPLTPDPQGEAEMLVEIYNWFTEGFDTKDLQEAKGLLVELRQRTTASADH